MQQTYQITPGERQYSGELALARVELQNLNPEPKPILSGPTHGGLLCCLCCVQGCPKLWRYALPAALCAHTGGSACADELLGYPRRR